MISAVVGGAGIAVFFAVSPPLLAQISDTSEILQRIEEVRGEIMRLQQELDGLQPVKTTLLSRNLKLGDTGEDVLELQVLLNSFPQTRIAATGLGSPGNETRFFGVRTRDAVIRFQQWYAGEILTPLGLNRGTGYVGFSTRAKLRVLVDQQNTSLALAQNVAPTPEPVVVESPRQREEFAPSSFPPVVDERIPEDYIHITFPSAYFGPVGTEVTYPGYGFAGESNTINFGPLFQIDNIIADSSGSLVFSIPAGISVGTYETWVTNKKGDSNTRFFIVTPEGATPPTAMRVTPETMGLNEQATIYGSGFMPTGNTIRTSYGIIENVPSPDGKVLSFNVSPPFLENVDLSDPRAKRAGFPMWVSVSNNNGLSEPAQFMMNL